jgi:hypothetical protein
MRYYILILLTFLLTSCGGTSYYLSTINHTPEYIGDVRVDKIENRMDLNWKLRTDNQFRWDFAQYAQNQPLSWYYDNSWELGLYRSNFTAFDLYWNRTTYWWNWSFNYPYNWGWNSWYPFRYNRFGWNSWGWNHWNYNHYRWNYRPNYIITPRVERPRVIVNGRRGSNNTNITINRGRSNNSTTNNSNVRVRRYDNKDRIVPRRNYNDVKIKNRTPINNNSRPARNYNVPRPNNNNNVRRTPPPPPTRPVVRPNVSRSSNVGRSSSQVIKRNND